MKFLSILMGKIIIFLGHILKRGSALPGNIAYMIDKNILKKIEKPELVIAVTGSSGKGSTSKIIAKVLKDLGYRVGYNDKGSNERGAIITTLIENSSLRGKTKVDIYVFEMDERYAKYVFPYFSPNYLVITNITKDQPPRQRDIDFIKEEISKSLNKDIKLVINADDPYLQSLTKNNKTYYYGINKNKYSYQKNIFSNLNISRCPMCNHKLEYSYYNIEQLGYYECPNCSFKTPDKDYEITNINYNKKEITINKEYKLNIDNDILFNLYNTLAAFTVLSICNLDKNKIINSINAINKDKKIYNIYKRDKQNIYVLNNKCENAQTYNQSILYTLRNKNKKMIVLGWKEISRRYEFDDLSWLYDIDFELLKNADKFIVAGPQRYDLKVRLKNAGISVNKIKEYNNLEDAKEAIKSYKHDIYAILNFDYIKPFTNIMEEE